MLGEQQQPISSTTSEVPGATRRRRSGNNDRNNENLFNISWVWWGTAIGEIRRGLVMNRCGLGVGIFGSELGEGRILLTKEPLQVSNDPPRDWRIGDRGALQAAIVEFELDYQSRSRDLGVG
jgi:hypothetical protein